METAVIVIIGVVLIIILLVLSPRVQKDIDKLHSIDQKTEHLKITCSDFLKVLEDNPDKELEITVKTYIGGEFGGYCQEDTKKITEINITDDKVKITYQ